MSKNISTPPTKAQLTEMFVNGTLYSFLMKKNIIKKGDTVNYAQLLDLSENDLLTFFEANGYPGLRSSPPSQECEYIWTLEDGVYTVWFIDRNTEFREFSTTSKDEFQEWWKKDTLKKYAFKLNYTWVV